MSELVRRESDFLLYTAPDGAVKVGGLFRDETAWLTQKALAELFGVGVPAINKHLKGIFESGELAEVSVVSILETTAADGKAYKTRFYRIREVRASERRFYQKLTDIYALAIDYDTHAPLTREFFAIVQNKLHWAITGQTAAELIYTSADTTKLFMGLTTWKDAPHGKILKPDVTVAKNYLSEAHVKEPNRIVSAEFVSDFDRVVEETKRLEGGAGQQAIGAGSAKARGATKPGGGPSKRRKKS